MVKTFDRCMSGFKKMKFSIKDEEHSKQIQEMLFKLGYGWGIDSKAKEYRSGRLANYFYANMDGSITHSPDSHYFKKHSHPESTLEDLQHMIAVKKYGEKVVVRLIYPPKSWHPEGYRAKTSQLGIPKDEIILGGPVVISYNDKEVKFDLHGLSEFEDLFEPVYPELEKLDRNNLEFPCLAVSNRTGVRWFVHKPTGDQYPAVILDNPEHPEDNGGIIPSLGGMENATFYRLPKGWKLEIEGGEG